MVTGTEEHLTEMQISVKSNFSSSYAAKKILLAAGLRQEGPNIIACPTCGRTNIDLIPIAQEVERRLAGCTKPITVAVMGCAVTPMAG